VSSSQQFSLPLNTFTLPHITCSVADTWNAALAPTKRKATWLGDYTPKLSTSSYTLLRRDGGGQKRSELR